MYFYDFKIAFFGVINQIYLKRNASAIFHRLRNELNDVSSLEDLHFTIRFEISNCMNFITL